MVDVSTFSAIIAATSVVIGVLFAVVQLRNMAKTRQTELALKLYSTFNSKEFQEAWTKIMSLEFKDYNDFVKKYGPPISENPVHVAIGIVCLHFHGIGILLYRKLIDISLVDDLFRDPIIMAWEKTKPILEGARKQFGIAGFVYFAYLHKAIQKRLQQEARSQ